MKTRMDHILEIAKALAGNPEYTKGRRGLTSDIVRDSYKILDKIEGMEIILQEIEERE